RGPLPLGLFVHLSDLLWEPLFRLPPLSESRELSQSSAIASCSITYRKGTRNTPSASLRSNTTEPWPSRPSTSVVDLSTVSVTTSWNSSKRSISPYLAHSYKHPTPPSAYN